jgi:hypothetical protein
MVDATVAAGQK